MSKFQYIAITFLLILTIRQLNRLYGQPLIKIIYGLRWVVVTTVASLIIIFPDISTLLSNYLGIGRGADLVIYFSLLWLLHKSYSDSEKIKDINQKLENINRKFALKNAKKHK